MQKIYTRCSVFVVLNHTLFARSSNYCCHYLYSVDVDFCGRGWDPSGGTRGMVGPFVVFLEVWKVCHARVEGLELRVPRVGLVLGEVIRIIDVLKQDEISDARGLSPQEWSVIVE
mgnify:CR=1 FL=1